MQASTTDVDAMNVSFNSDSSTSSTRSLIEAFENLVLVKFKYREHEDMKAFIQAVNKDVKLLKKLPAFTSFKDQLSREVGFPINWLPFLQLLKEVDTGNGLMLSTGNTISFKCLESDSCFDEDSIVLTENYIFIKHGSLQASFNLRKSAQVGSAYLFLLEILAFKKAYNDLHSVLSR